MLERVIANWLTNTNERYYQLPFVQVLIAEGHTVLHVSRHGPGEQGKDIITKTPDGAYHAYQLKCGDIKTGEWRAIREEIRDLQQLPLKVPLVGRRTKYESYLVTNGVISADVLQSINDMNAQAADHAYPPVGVVQGTELLQRFTKVADQFLPAEIPDAAAFLDVLRADGRDFLLKEKFYSVLSTQLATLGLRSRRGEVIQAIAACAVNASFLLSPYQHHDNYFALFEAWAMVAASVLHSGLSLGLPEKWWHPTYELAVDEAADALRLLTETMLQRDTFIEGDIRGEGGWLYDMRATLVLGAAATSILCDSEATSWTAMPIHADAVAARIEKALGEAHIWYWGDSALPAYAGMVMLLKVVGRAPAASGLVAQQVSDLCEFCAPFQPDGSATAQGVPSPYYSPGRVAASLQRTVSRAIGVIREFRHELDIDLAQFVGESYALRPFIEMAARLELRDVVQEAWPAVTRVASAEFVPTSDLDGLLLKTDLGKNVSRWEPETQSWSALVAESRADDASDWWQPRTDFLWQLALVYPHRCTARLLRHLDSATTTSAAVG